MKKLIFILLIILVLFLIFNYSKENFQATTTQVTTQAIDNDEIIKNIGFDKINETNIISCNKSEDPDNSVTIQSGSNDYSSCFDGVNYTNNNFVEIVESENKCNYYTENPCSTGPVNLQSSIDFSDNVLFEKVKSRNILDEEVDIGGTEIKLIDHYIHEISNNSNESIFTSIEDFKIGDYFIQLSNFPEKLLEEIDASKNIHLNDLYCSLAEHLFVQRLYLEKTNDDIFPRDKLIERINSFNYKTLLNGIFEDIKTSGESIPDNYNKSIYLKTDHNYGNLVKCYNFQIAKVLLLSAIAKLIMEDKLLEKYNSKYITYLFYSFKRGNKIWSSYFSNAIERLNINNKFKNSITSNFFNNPNNENIYKLFIYFIGKLTFTDLKYYNDSAASSSQTLPVNDSTRLINIQNNKIESLNIENIRYVFYFQNEIRDTNTICRQSNNNEDECNNLNAFGCSYNSETKVCHGRYEYENCMQYTNPEKCNSLESCEFNKNMCLPKNCFTTNANGQIDCSTNFKHCNQFDNIILDNRVQQICHDNLRMVKGDDESIEINNNFYLKNQNILDNCVDKIYNNPRSDQPILKDSRELNESCRDGCILGNFDNRSNICVDNKQINPDNFYDGRFCDNINNKENCDIVQSCFWEGNKCFPNSGNDQMKCTDFGSEERCPKNNCVWYDGRCNSLYNEDDAALINSRSINPDDPNPTTLSSNFEITNPKCAAINNDNHSSIEDKRKECEFNNCYWMSDRNLCVDNINHGCLFKSQQDCVDRDKNFDPLYLKNRCKLISDPESQSTKPVCVDNNLKLPCKFHSVDNCPTDENPKVNFYGEQIESPYCELNINQDKCVDKESYKSDSCLYNYLKDGGASDDNFSRNCKEIDIVYREEGTQGPTNKVSTVFNREHLPCSLLENDNCLFGENSSQCKIINN
jgi:hypothetical protein